MKKAALLGDVLTSLVTSPATRCYPIERTPTPESLRGRLEWDPSDCIGCGLCAKDCPSEALEVIVLDRKAKRFVVRYHVDRCLFCSQCVVSCRRNSLKLSHEDWELAALDRDGFTLYYGSPEDIQEVRNNS